MARVIERDKNKERHDGKVALRNGRLGNTACVCLGYKIRSKAQAKEERKCMAGFKFKILK